MSNPISFGAVTEDTAIRYGPTDLHPYVQPLFTYHLGKC